MKKVYVGSFTGLAAIVAAWVAIGVGGPSTSLSTCPLPAYPDATCTGIPEGTTLTPVVGNLDVNTAGATVDAQDVAGCIIVHQPGVTIKNSRAQCVKMGDPGDPSQDPDNERATVQDSEIDCKVGEGGTSGVTGIFYQNVNIYRTDIQGCDNGVDAYQHVTLQDSYIHDLSQCTIPGCPGPDQAHTDGIQSSDGSDVTIEHNTIYAFTPPCQLGNEGLCNGTSAININNDSGGPVSTDVLIKNNLLAGGAYSMYCPIVAPDNYQLVRNHFSTTYSPVVGEFGLSTACADETQISNVIHETGALVELG